MKTLKQRTITYARAYPWQSATQIANALKAKPSYVSSILAKAVKVGRLSRIVPGDWPGPRGGHLYGPPHNDLYHTSIAELGM